MKTSIKTYSRRKPLRFWGWGYVDEELSNVEQGLVRVLAGQYTTSGLTEVATPALEEFDLPPSRLKPSATLQPIVT